MLDLVFSNIADLHITFPGTGMVKPDVFHPPLSIVMPSFVKHVPKLVNYRTSNTLVVIIHYYITFFLHMSGHVCIQNLLLMLLLPASIPLFMKPLIALFPEALLNDLIFPIGCPHSRALYFEKEFYYRRFKKNKTDLYYSKFSYYRKLVKITIQSDRST
jgi:hypothetical protein